MYPKSNMHRAIEFIRRRKRRSLVIGVVLVVLIIVAFSTFGKSKQPQYRTAQVTRGTIISSVTESGNIASDSQAGVGSPTTGVVTDLYVKDGDTVTQGQDLFKVKSTATAQETASAFAAYENAIVAANTAGQNKIISQATLEKDRAAVITASQAVTDMQNRINASQPNPDTHEQYKQNEIDLINSALTSARETFSADEMKYKQIDQNIAASNASLHSAQLAYQATQDSVVTAPVDGTVANITIQPGDQISATSGSLTSNQSSNASSSTATNAVLSIGNFTKPYIKVQASEVDIPNLKSGQKAVVSLNAFSGKTFVGTVEQVDSVGTISSGVVTYNVFISLIAPPSDIMSGMTSSVTIETARKDDVLTVPTAAIQTVSGSPTVRILRNGQVATVDVTTGIASDTDTEITSGLSEGETVITGTVATGSTANGTTSPFGRGFGGGFGGGGGAVIRRGG